MFFSSEKLEDGATSLKPTIRKRDLFLKILHESILKTLVNDLENNLLAHN